jgi:hypothetical protein
MPGAASRPPDRRKGSTPPTFQFQRKSLTAHSVAKETDTRPRSAIQNLQRLVHGQASIASDSIWYPCRSF